MGLSDELASGSCCRWKLTDYVYCKFLLSLDFSFGINQRGFHSCFVTELLFLTGASGWFVLNSFFAAGKAAEYFLKLVYLMVTAREKYEISHPTGYVHSQSFQSIVELP